MGGLTKEIREARQAVIAAEVERLAHRIQRQKAARRQFMDAPLGTALRGLLRHAEYYDMRARALRDEVRRVKLQDDPEQLLEEAQRILRYLAKRIEWLDWGDDKSEHVKQTAAAYRRLVRVLKKHRRPKVEHAGGGTARAERKPDSATRRRVSLHEAGHIAAFVLAHEPCRAVLMDEPGVGVHGVVQTIRPEHELEAGTGGWPSLAGAVASEMFGHDTQDSRSDLHHARLYAAAYCRPGHDPLTVPDHEIDTVLERWRREARQRLEPLKKTIDALARELEQRGELSWEQIQKVIHETRPFAA